MIISVPYGPYSQLQHAEILTEIYTHYLPPVPLSFPVSRTHTRVYALARAHTHTSLVWCVCVCVCGWVGGLDCAVVVVEWSSRPRAFESSRLDQVIYSCRKSHERVLAHMCVAHIIMKAGRHFLGVKNNCYCVFGVFAPPAAQHSTGAASRTVLLSAHRPTQQAHLPAPS